MAYAVSIGLVALTRFGYGPRGDGDTAIAGADPRGFLAAELAEPGIALLGGPGLPTSVAAAQMFYRDAAERRAERDRAAVERDRTRQFAELAALSPVFADAAVAQGVALAPRGSPQPVPTMAAAEPAKPGTVAKLGTVAKPGTMARPGTLTGAAMPGVSAADEKPAAAVRPEGIVFRDEALARLRRAVEARAGFAERLVAFWSNHFCVAANKGGISRVTVGAFEREAIRPHVLGRFSDMLLAVAAHPAMLHYLDNAPSVGPNSRAGANGRRGLNENLGRELMELHTLGVGSGYTQVDVTNLARILTGWTIVGAGGKGKDGRGGEPGAFAFNPAAHEPGPIDLLGRSYPDTGVQQGRDALLDLARRPETARFIAGKFARAFIGDAPPPALLDRLSAVFRETDGDLRQLALTLVHSPEAWVRQPVRVRSPYEFVVGTYRLLGHVPDEPNGLLGAVREMGMPLWTPPGPNGFPDASSAWATPEGMKLRLDWAAAQAQKLKDPPNPSEVLQALTGGAPSDDTRAAIAGAESRQQGLALLFMSPEMQRS